MIYGPRGPGPGPKSIGQPAGGLGSVHPTPKAGGQERAFDAVLAQELAKTTPVRFSAHAEARLRAAGIRLDGRDLERLGAAIDRLAAKGGRSSLVLLGDLALVVSVVNRTVITAVEPSRVRENVFTNIDSAAIT